MLKVTAQSWIWCDGPVILAFRRLRKEDRCELQASLGYRVRPFLRIPPLPMQTTGAFDSSLPVRELRCFRRRLYHVAEEFWIGTELQSRHTMSPAHPEAPSGSAQSSAF